MNGNFFFDILKKHIRLIEYVSLVGFTYHHIALRVTKHRIQDSYDNLSAQPHLRNPHSPKQTYQFQRTGNLKLKWDNQCLLQANQNHSTTCIWPRDSYQKTPASACSPSGPQHLLLRDKSCKESNLRLKILNSERPIWSSNAPSEAPRPHGRMYYLCGHIPSLWKQAKNITIPNNGKQSFLGSLYRPFIPSFIPSHFSVLPSKY